MIVSGEADDSDVEDVKTEGGVDRLRYLGMLDVSLFAAVLNRFAFKIINFCIILFWLKSWRRRDDRSGKASKVKIYATRFIPSKILLIKVKHALRIILIFQLLVTFKYI
jgi:hypothetical protein